MCYIWNISEFSKQRESAMTKRCALYVRVSTTDKGQTTENQTLELTALAATRGWTITKTYEDAISGSKGRDKRPGLDAMLKDAVRGRFDVLLSWSVDRLGRSLADLVSILNELHGAHVDLVLMQQALDTTTPAGKALFGMLGVFSEFEREMIRARVKTGMDRAKAEQAAGKERVGPNGTRKKLIGQQPLSAARIATVREALDNGLGFRAVALETGVSARSVARISQASISVPGDMVLPCA
jgi:DNA invertase Pin-like site-specific DNA recombinase